MHITYQRGKNKRELLSTSTGSARLEREIKQLIARCTSNIQQVGYVIFIIFCPMLLLLYFEVVGIKQT